MNWASYCRSILMRAWRRILPRLGLSTEKVRGHCDAGFMRCSIEILMWCRMDWRLIKAAGAPRWWRLSGKQTVSKLKTLNLQGFQNIGGFYPFNTPNKIII